MLFNTKLFFLLFFILSLGRAQELTKGFTYLENHIPNLKVELRYATTDNFMGRIVQGYRPNQKVIGTLALAKALKKVQKQLATQHLGLKIFDAYRPQRAVNDFIEWSKHPQDTLTKQKYYPKLVKNRLFKLGFIAEKSGHSRGSTVDLTLVFRSGSKKGKALDMGSSWDFFGIISHYNYKNITSTQKENRKLLREVMISAGFVPYEKEWWHFTLQKEPFYHTYFDFVSF